MFGLVAHRLAREPRGGVELEPHLGRLRASIRARNRARIGVRARVRAAVGLGLGLGWGQGGERTEPECGMRILTWRRSVRRVGPYSRVPWVGVGVGVGGVG